MTEEKPPNPLTDLRKGLGLLFRAAATTARKLPTTNLGKELEQAVVTSAREVGRAIENVATTIEREVRSRTGSAAAPPAGGRESPRGKLDGENEGRDEGRGDPGTPRTGDGGTPPSGDTRTPRGGE